MIKKYSLSDINKRTRELEFQVRGKSHLYLETCEECSMPFILSTGYRPRYICDDCRDQIKKDHKWAKKVKQMEKEGLLA